MERAITAQQLAEAMAEMAEIKRLLSAQATASSTDVPTPSPPSPPPSVDPPFLGDFIELADQEEQT